MASWWAGAEYSQQGHELATRKQGGQLNSECRTLGGKVSSDPALQGRKHGLG